MDPIKEAFQKIKEEIGELRQEILNIKNSFAVFHEIKSQYHTPSNPSHSPAQTLYPTDTPTQTPTVPQETRGSQHLKNIVSTGNEGVPTDTSTNRQTIPQTDKPGTLLNRLHIDNSLSLHETLSSLDAIKKELRLKFKRITPQEMLVFSTLYNLENQGFEEISYKMIANNLNLSESSIRDYVSKLSTKGIPILKHRLNNKQISLNISPDLQKIASLATITRLREL